MLTVEEMQKFTEDLKDDSFRREFFGRFMGLDDWRVQWDKLKTPALKMLSDTFPGQFSIEQLFYFANRHAAEIRSSYVPRAPKPFIGKPRVIYVWVIYWLYRVESPEIPLYVGQTRQLSERWTAHKNGSSETACIEDRSSLRIKVVETVCGNERHALAAEKRHIEAALAINPNLLNKAST